MKTFLKIAVLSAVLLMLAGGLISCDRDNDNSHCYLDRPQDLRPIDWESYNDVYTIFWTYSKLEDGFAHSTREIRRDTAKVIKLYGWLHQGNDSSVDITSLTLVGSETYIFTQLEELHNFFPLSTLPRVSLRLVSGTDLEETLKQKFDTIDITRKLYVRGRLYFGPTVCVTFADQVGCCWIDYFFIRIYSADDIYFE